MAQAQLGNELGVAAADAGSRTLANITADGVNTITVDSIKNLQVGQLIDLTSKTTGVVLAAARTIDGITSALVVTYSGADVAAVPGTTVVVESGFNPTVRAQSNLNGGFGAKSALASNNISSIAAARQRLKIIAPTTYTDAYLDRMTFNDMVYAIRVNDFPTTIKQ